MMELVFRIFAVFVFGHLISGQLLYDGKTGSLYRFHRECKTQPDARQYCQREGGDLVIINSEEEAQLLLKLFKLNPDQVMIGCPGYKSEIFIGAHLNSTKGEFTTFKGETLEEAGYAKWNEGEPNNVSSNPVAGEQCVTMLRTTKLNDLYCGQRRPFVCEIPGYVYKPESDSLFRLQPFEYANWQNACAICKSQGGHLAVVNSIEELKEIQQLFGNYTTEQRRHALFNLDVAFVGFQYYNVQDEYMTVQGETLNDAGYSDVDCRHNADAESSDNTCGVVHSSGILFCVECKNVAQFVCEIQRSQRNFGIVHASKNTPAASNAIAV